MQTGRQGDAGGLQDATDLAGDGGAGGDALPSFSIVASWRSRSRSRSPLSHDQAARSGPEEGGSSVLSYCAPERLTRSTSDDGPSAVL